MTVTFPDIQVGSPIKHDGLAVFPLFVEPGKEVEYTLSDEAIGDGTVTVEEVSEAGSVPDLSVENKGEVRVLFLEGEELIGAKQNRVLNTSVLIPAHTKAKIPVSCVEEGRWGYETRTFGSGGTHAPSKLRYHLKASVSHSLQSRQGHVSDQDKVWEEVERQQKALRTSSCTGAMADTFEAHQERIEEFRRRLSYVENAIGVAVAVGNRVVTCDVFDKPTTCEKVWDRLLSGGVLDALELDHTTENADVADVEVALTNLNNLPWKSVAPVGEGEELRAESPHGEHASALVFDDVLVHGSIVGKS